MDNIDKFVEVRKKHILDTNEENGAEHFNSLRAIGKKPYYVPCTECCDFDTSTYFCSKLNTIIDWRIVPVGCGDGDIMPF